MLPRKAGNSPRIRRKVATMLEIQNVPIDILIPHKGNPRSHSKKQIRQIADSINVFGFVMPILVDKNMRIVCGHARTESAKLCGMSELPVIVNSDLTESQINAYMVADNRLVEVGCWDDTLLAQHLKELSEAELDFSIEATGFEMGEIDFMISGLSSLDEGKPDPADELPDLKNEAAVSKVGDVWTLNKHRLLCGNALEESSFATLMMGQKAIMAFVDPPYNVRINGHVGGAGSIKHREFPMASGEMSKLEFISFLNKALTRLTENSTDGSIHYVSMDFRHMSEILTAGQVYTELKNLCVWVKDNAGMGSFYRSQHELFFVFKNGTKPHQNNFKLGQYGRHRTNVWQYPSINSFAQKSEEGNLLNFHPTVKPVALISDAIMDCSSRGDIILDCFAGSGSSILAAERVGRYCYAMELDPLYIDTAIRRWQKLTGAHAVHEQTGQRFDDMAALVKGASHEP